MSGPTNADCLRPLYLPLALSDDLPGVETPVSDIIEAAADHEDLDQEPGGSLRAAAWAIAAFPEQDGGWAIAAAPPEHRTGGQP